MPYIAACCWCKIDVKRCVHKKERGRFSVSCPLTMLCSTAVTVIRETWFSAAGLERLFCFQKHHWAACQRLGICVCPHPTCFWSPLLGKSGISVYCSFHNRVSLVPYQEIIIFRSMQRDGRFWPTYAWNASNDCDFIYDKYSTFLVTGFTWFVTKPSVAYIKSVWGKKWQCIAHFLSICCSENLLVLQRIFGTEKVHSF